MMATVSIYALGRMPPAIKESVVLDRKRLREMSDGDADFERELIGTYRSSATSILAQLHAHLTVGNVVGIAREAHALKGASLSVGADAMAMCASEIETAARAGDARRANDKLDDLRLQAQALWIELEQF
jgi:HPt (histidine-containing phosphotransfer) domain-containing protein